MRGTLTLYIDQWGNHYWARTLRELREQIGRSGSTVSKMYQDKRDGSVVHIGYVVGQHWLTAYQRVERAA